jgi:hypothetical protein
VRGRGLNQRPLDLLVADGVAVARLRHDTIRGRTNRHGFVCACNEVRASSHRYFRHHLETANCTIHLCSQDPCTAPEVSQVHIKASSVIPPRTGRSICRTLLEGDLGVGARSLPAFAGPCGADVAARAYPGVQKSGAGVFLAGGARGGFPARAKGRSMARATGMTTPKPSRKRRSDPWTNLARRIKSLLIPVAR